MLRQFLLLTCHECELTLNFIVASRLAFDLGTKCLPLLQQGWHIASHAKYSGHAHDR